MTEAANPWENDGPIDLSEAELSIDQKTWLGSQLASGSCSLSELHDLKIKFGCIFAVDVFLPGTGIRLNSTK